jgi:hypothetical protein
MSKDPDEVVSKVAEFKAQGDAYTMAKQENPNAMLPLPTYGSKAETYTANLKTWVDKAQAKGFAAASNQINADEASTAAIAARHPNLPAPQPGLGAGALTPDEVQSQMEPFAGTAQQANVDKLVAERQNQQDTNAQLNQPIDQVDSATFYKNASNAGEGRPITENTKMVGQQIYKNDVLEAQKARDAKRAAMEAARLRLAKWHESKQKDPNIYTPQQIMDDIKAFSAEDNALDDDINHIHNKIADTKQRIIVAERRLQYTGGDPKKDQSIMDLNNDLNILTKDIESKQVDKDNIKKNLGYLTNLQDKYPTIFHNPAVPRQRPVAAPAGGRTVSVGGVNATIRLK